MKYTIGLIVLATILTGCATKTLVMNKDEQSSLNGKTITAIQKTSPKHPQINTPGKALGAALMGGGILGVALAGLSDDKANNLEIPSNYISEKITPSIAKKFNMVLKEEKEKEKKETSLSILETKEDITELDRLKATYTSDYLLDIDTYNWMITHTKWNGGASYVIIMRNNLRLIERESQKIVSSINCEYNPKDKEILPTYDELFANDGKLIKEESRKASDLCIEKIKAELFN
jgi:hypothetical protein